MDCIFIDHKRHVVYSDLAHTVVQYQLEINPNNSVMTYARKRIDGCIMEAHYHVVTISYPSRIIVLESIQYPGVV
jgi:hypothetical protein